MFSGDFWGVILEIVLDIFAQKVFAGFFAFFHLIALDYLEEKKKLLQELSARVILHYISDVKFYERNWSKRRDI